MFNATPLLAEATAKVYGKIVRFPARAIALWVDLFDRVPLTGLGTSNYDED
ncbi:MAG: hypothetical protein SW833_14170 [Cyanobacteriota bacterium]|nr:hypothetical protein [Cyanobacteriota bacterium]